MHTKNNGSGTMQRVNTFGLFKLKPHDAFANRDYAEWLFARAESTRH